MSERIAPFQLEPTEWNGATRKSFLAALCDLVLEPDLTYRVARQCRPILLVLLSLLTDPGRPSKSLYLLHAAISKLLVLAPTGIGYVVLVFVRHRVAFVLFPPCCTLLVL